MPMTDDELCDYCAITDPVMRMKFLATLTPAKRKTFDRMKEVEIEAALYAEGLGPKPQGVLLDFERDTKRRRGWR